MKEKKLIFLSVVVFTGAALAINYFTESQIYSDSNLEPIVNLDSLIDKGNESYDRGEYDNALANYEKVLRVQPSNQYGLYNKALVFYAQKNFRKSISLTRYCIEINPDFAVAYFLLGDDYKFIDQRDSALYFFEQAYELGSRDSGLLQNRGDFYFDQQKKKQAASFYKEAIQQDTTLVDVYDRLAELDPDQAAMYRDKAAQLKK